MDFSFSFTTVLAVLGLFAAACYIFFHLLNRVGKRALLITLAAEYLLIFLADLSHRTPDHLFQICSVSSCEFVSFWGLFWSAFWSLLVLNACTLFLLTFLIAYLLYRFLRRHIALPTTPTPPVPPAH